MKRTRAELAHAEAELARLHQRAADPQVPLPLAALATLLLVMWGNGVVLLGRRLDAPDVVTLVAHPALSVGVVLVLLQRGWSPAALGFRRPEPEPASRSMQVLLGILAGAAAVASALTLVLDPSKGLELARLLVATAGGEEVLHRGALLALWASTQVPPAVTTAVSMAAFGAWHIAGAFHDGAFHPLEVAVPAVGTLAFLWARLRYRSIAAPTVLHVATNLPGILAGG